MVSRRAGQREDDVWLLRTSGDQKVSVITNKYLHRLSQVNTSTDPVGVKTLRTQDTGTGAKLSGHFVTSLMVPKCLGSEVSWV